MVDKIHKALAYIESDKMSRRQGRRANRESVTWPGQVPHIEPLGYEMSWPNQTQRKVVSKAYGNEHWAPFSIAIAFQDENTDASVDDGTYEDSHAHVLLVTSRSLPDLNPPKLSELLSFQERGAVFVWVENAEDLTRTAKWVRAASEALLAIGVRTTHPFMMIFPDGHAPTSKERATAVASGALPFFAPRGFWQSPNNATRASILSDYLNSLRSALPESGPSLDIHRMGRAKQEELIRWINDGDQ